MKATDTLQHFETIARHHCQIDENSTRYQETLLGLDWENQTEGERSNYWSWGVSIQDINQDGYWDVFLPQMFESDQLFFGRKEGVLEDVSFLLPELAHVDKLSFGSTIEDINQDQYLDILVSTEGSNYFYLGQANEQFQLVTEEDFSSSTILQTENHHLAIGYVDDDEYPDLFGPTFYGRYFPENVDEPLNNLLYWGQETGRWQREENWCSELEQTPANAGGWIDIDDDGDLDLFIANDKPQVGFHSGILVNQGERQLEYLGDRGLDFVVEGMGLSWGDLNLDGLLDIAVTGWGNFALGIGEGDNYWYEASQVWGLESAEQHVVGWGIELVDLDNDGDQDVLVANGAKYDENGLGGAPSDPLQNTEIQYFSVYLNQNDHLEFQTTTEWAIGEGGNYRGFAMVDWNNDGYLDIFARDLGRSAKYFQSNCRKNKSLIVLLEQDGANHSAIGARIWARDSLGNEQFRDIQVGSSNISSSSPPMAHFGVGEQEFISLDIRWPDGSFQTLERIETGQTIRIHKETIE